MSKSSYIESGVEWIGRLPCHWQLKPMFSVVEQLGEKNIGSRVQNLLSLSYGKIVRRDFNSSFGLLPESFDTYQIVQSGDVVLRLLDLQNDHVSLRVGLVKEEGIITSAYISIRPTKGVSSHYLAYLLYCYDIKKVFYSFGGGCRQSMGFEELRRLPIPFPPPGEQCCIVSYLDEQIAKIDRLMDMRRRQIELLKEQRAALIQQVVTRGLNPDVLMKDSGIEWLGEIPTHWQTKVIKYVAQIKRGRFGYRPRTEPSLYDGPFPFVQTGDVARANKYLTSYTQSLTKKGFNVSVEFPAGTLLMAIAANIGDLAILGINACLPDSIVGLFPYNENNVEFLYYQLALLQKNFRALAPENTQLNLNIDRLGPEKIVCPPLAEQLQICSFIKEIEKKIEASIASYSRQLTLLTEYRSALIHECVTGQRQVPDIPASLQEEANVL